MIDLQISLQKDSSYVNAGNILSKSFLVTEYIHGKKLLFMVNDIKKRRNFENVFSFILQKYTIVNDYSSFIDMLSAEDGLYLCTYEIFYANFVSGYDFKQHYLYTLVSGEESKIDAIIHKISDFGYKYSEYRKLGSYKKIGDLLCIYPNFTEDYFFRINFFGDEIEKIEKVFEKYSTELTELSLGKIELFTQSLDGSFASEVLDMLRKHAVSFLGEGFDFYPYKTEIQAQLKTAIFFDAIKNKQNKGSDLHIHELYLDDLGSLTQYLQDEKYLQRFVFTKNKATLDNFLNYNNISGVKVFDCRIKKIGSFYTDTITGKNTLVIADDNLDRVFVKKRVKRSFSKDLDLLVHIKEGDYITHIDHGVGIFQGIVKRELLLQGKTLIKEYLELEYLAKDKLFVPITEVKRVSKYIGKEHPKLTGLSTKEWSKKLKKVSEEVDDIAEDLLEIFAQRSLKKGFAFQKDNKKIESFQDSFPYAYTDDQSAAINDILEDMGLLLPMDRLLNGDVGFGKTEVCFNAIFNAFMNKKQSILLTPLVVLAYEHYEKACERFADFGMKVGVLTRFEKTNAVLRTLEKLRKGDLDLVVGTHKLLSPDVVFHDLGLVVIDEEHKFGVKDKERIKELKGQIDILSLSATPIPRSLNMALNGLKQVSILKTPPYGRKPIETYVSRFSDEIIVDACRQEFERGGQVFFIHNRVQNIEAFQNYLQTLFPHKSIIVTHGQLPGDDLEKRIIAFRKREYDILLSTTVIENGVDFPNVNTIFINDAYKFGISQIHQLRGRVGRSERQGYCHLIYRNENINAEAEKRLKTIVDYSHLGAGFELAMRDLEVRGGGEILGKRQSGQVSEVGISIFIEMLEEKISELKRLHEYKAQKSIEKINIIRSSPENIKNNSLKNNTGKSSENIDKKTRLYALNTTIDLNISAYISDDFFGSSMDKMNFYRELETVENGEDLQIIIDEFQQINSELPPETQNLFRLLNLKFSAAKFGISAIKKNGQNYQLNFSAPQGQELEVLRSFLDRDKKVRFLVIDTQCLRTPVKHYGSDLAFMEYMIDILLSKIVSKKYKLKK